MRLLKETGAGDWHTVSAGPVSFHAYATAAAAADGCSFQMMFMMMVDCRHLT